MSIYLLTLETSHGPIRAVWEPGSQIQLFVSADDQPETVLGEISETATFSEQEIWTEIARQMTIWVRAEIAEIQIHGITRVYRQTSSFDELLRDLNFA